MDSQGFRGSPHDDLSACVSVTFSGSHWRGDGTGTDLAGRKEQRVAWHEQPSYSHHTYWHCQTIWLWFANPYQITLSCLCIYIEQVCSIVQVRLSSWLPRLFSAAKSNSMLSWDVPLSHSDQEKIMNINYVAIEITPASSVWGSATTYKLTWLNCQEYECKHCDIYIDIYVWSNTYPGKLG